MIALAIVSFVVVAAWALFAAFLPPALRRAPELVVPASVPRRSVSVVIPARDEETLLPRCLASLAKQTLVPNRIVVVDDHSTDGTRAVARRFEGVSIVTPPERPAGWKGKCWAAWNGQKEATGEFVLFLDADADLAPDALAATVAAAEREGAGLLCTMIRAECGSTFEALVQPVMLLFLVAFLDARRVNDPEDAAAASPGAYMFFSRKAYDAVGGHEAVRDEIVDDLKLAQAVKSAKLGLRMVNGARLVATSRTQTASQIWNGWCRVTVDGLGRKAWAGFVGAALALVFLVMPPAVAIALHPPLVLHPATANPWAIATVASGILHVVLMATVRFQLASAYGIDARFAFLQPVASLFPVAVLLRSALAALGVAGEVRWRGRDMKA
ncbi:MAG: glycosyltransferase family 2 protein [Polyangiaceae bacterium]